MSDFPVRLPEQLPTLLKSLRKKSGLTQAEVALRFGVKQQSYSTLERNADKMSADRLLTLLSILGAEVILRTSSEKGTSKPHSGPNW